MRLLALLYHYLIPRFETAYYLFGTSDGEDVVLVLNSPDDVDEEVRQYVIGASFFVLFGDPYLIRYFPCQ